MKLQSEAEIIPNIGLGGLKLRAKITDIQELFTGLGVSKKGSFRIISPFEVAYSFGEGEVEATVDVRNGKIFRLTAQNGYAGTLFDKIRVGMKISEAVKSDPGFYYDESQEIVLHKGTKGLAIDVSETDPPPEIVPDLDIAAISVYAEETDTLRGQEGCW